MGWSYQREESNNGEGFVSRIKAGDKLRVRVKSVEKAQSKTGNDMLVFQFDVSGHPDIIYYYIPFLQDRPEVTNGKLTQFFDSFKDIADGDFDMLHWMGKVGAACFKMEEYNGQMNPKISWFIKADKQGDLPAWVEPVHNGDSGDSSSTQPTGEFMNVPDSQMDEIPF